MTVKGRGKKGRIAMAEEGGGMDGGEHDVVQQVDGSEVIQVKDADDEGGKVLEEQGAEDVEKGEDAIKDDDESKVSCKRQKECRHRFSGMMC